MWKPSIPDFTQSGQEMHKLRVEIHCPSFNHGCHRADFHETHASAATTEFHENPVNGLVPVSLVY